MATGKGSWSKLFSSRTYCPGKKKLYSSWESNNGRSKIRGDWENRKAVFPPNRMRHRVDDITRCQRRFMLKWVTSLQTDESTDFTNKYHTLVFVILVNLGPLFLLSRAAAQFIKIYWLWTCMKLTTKFQKTWSKKW